jgi:ribosomal protein S12 methylthiotransferase
VPAKTKAARHRRAMKLQQRIAGEIGAAQVGRTLRVLVEAPLVGRAQADAPDIDGRVMLDRAASVGKFVDVKITGSDTYDLTGTPCV